MEVKKKGIDPKTWRYDGICPHCKAELAIGYKDINMYLQKGIFKTSLCFTVRCCECGHTSRLEEKQIPSIIRQAILEEMDELDMLINFFL